MAPLIGGCSVTAVTRLPLSHMSRVSSRPAQLSHATRRHVPLTRSCADSAAVSQVFWHTHKVEWKLIPFCAQRAACVHKRPSLFKRALTCCLFGVWSVLILMYVLIEAWSIVSSKVDMVWGARVSPPQHWHYQIILQHLEYMHCRYSH